jgi:aldose 1-epimerase
MFICPAILPEKERSMSGKPTAKPYGTTASGAAVDQYTLSNAAGVEVTILTYGGIISSVKVPDRYGNVANVALGCTDLAGYQTRSPYFGALIGRYGNRLAGGRFTLDGKVHSVPVNNGPNSLHGGLVGFDKKIWRAKALAGATGDAALELTLVSPDDEEGYPGTLNATVVYTLTDANGLQIDYAATTDKPTVINLTNHAYWNLLGEGRGSVYNHILRLDCDRYTPVDETLIPTGELASVAGTPFDFRTGKAIAAAVRSDHPQVVIGRGVDHNFVLNRPSFDDRSLIRAARVYEPGCGRVMEVWTTEPGIQIYTGNFLDGSVYGPSGHAYRQGDAIALETQHFPDSPNHPNFPSTELRPGQTYRSTTVFKFAVD